MKRAIVLTFLVTLFACSSTSSAPAGPVADAGGTEDGGAEAPAIAPVTLLASFDLPRTTSTQGLSGAWFDAATRTLHAIQDVAPSIVPLHASEDWKTWTVGTPIVVTSTSSLPWDGEGLVRTASGFFAITSETTPSLASIDASGKLLAMLSLPAHFQDQAPGNKGLESLTMTPSGRFLFTANEGALPADDTLSTKSKGTTVRILRRETDASGLREIAYRTEPLGAGGATGDMGVSDLAAISDDQLLVLERGFQAGYGNTVRIFRIAFEGPDVQDAAVGPSTPVVAKTLLLDLSTLPSEGITHPGTQPNPILDNYEALALGPLLPDGRRLLFVVSDDNASASQVARVLVLAVAGL